VLYNALVKQNRPFILLAMLILLPAMSLAGCVQRSITITSKPDGALVHLNDEEVGRTPLTVPFTFYGVYQVQLERDGFQTLLTEQNTEAPWWDNAGPDFFAEILPGRRKVQIDWHFDLEASKPVDEDKLIERAGELRDQTRKQTPSE
jgi:hypothetical protein